MPEVVLVYRGATMAHLVNDTYSFVPCRPFDGDEVRFEGPVIEAEPYINTNLRMRAKVTSASRRGSSIDPVARHALVSRHSAQFAITSAWADSLAIGFQG